MAKTRLPRQGELFPRTANEMEQRRQHRIGMLAVHFGIISRGTRRYPGVETHPGLPEHIADADITDVGRYLQRQSQPLVDKITGSYGIEPNAHSIEMYVLGANKNNRRVGKTQDEQVAIENAKRLQSIHVVTLLERNLRLKTQTAQVYRAALASVQESSHQRTPLNQQAATYAAAAVEDFGICLRTSRVTSRSTRFVELGRKIEHVGVYAYDHPEYLLEDARLLKLVRIEEKKREEFWGVRQQAVVAYDRDRRTQEEIQTDEDIAELIQSFASSNADTATI